MSKEQCPYYAITLSGRLLSQCCLEELPRLADKHQALGIDQDLHLMSAEELVGVYLHLKSRGQGDEDEQ